jgi:hypothetical protein
MARAEHRRLAKLAREAARANRRIHRAHRDAATGAPQTAKTWMIVAGISIPTADRFASAISRAVPARHTIMVTVKPRAHSRRTKTVTAKQYDRHTFAIRLATYRPRDPAAAREFAHATL